MTLEEQLMDVNWKRYTWNDSPKNVCESIECITPTCKELRINGKCSTCIGEILLSSLREIEPELTENNFKDTIRIHVVLRG